MYIPCSNTISEVKVVLKATEVMKFNCTVYFRVLQSNYFIKGYFCIIFTAVNMGGDLWKR